MLPCGMPWVMVLKDDWACWVWVDWVLPWKYDPKRAAVLGVKLNSLSSLCMSVLWDTVSYAFERST